MIRKIVIAGLGATLLACMPAHGQEMPELEGAPPPLKIPKASTPQPKVVTPAPKPKVVVPAPKPKAPSPVVSTSKADEALKAEQARLDKQAAELKARQAALDVRAAELAAREKQLAEQTVSQQEALAAQRADIKRQRDELSRQMAQAPAPAPVVRPAERDDDKIVTPPSRRSNSGGLNLAAAERSCALAAEDEARERNFYSAEYDEEPYFFQTRTLQLRGAMRLEDRRGHVIVNTVCELDRDGEAVDIAFMR